MNRKLTTPAGNSAAHVSHPPGWLLRSWQRGVTLVELMVSITVGLILVGGLVTYFASQRTTYAYQEALSTLQDNARIALQFIANDLRQAGYVGCVGQRSQRITDAVFVQDAQPAGPPTGWDLAVMGQEAFGPASTVDGVAVVPDRLIINKSVPTGLFISPMATQISDIVVDSADPLFAAANVALSTRLAVGDCQQAAIFRPTNISGGTIQFRPVTPGATENVDLLYTYGAPRVGPAELLTVQRVRYYLQKPSRAGATLALYRDVGLPGNPVNDPAPYELVEGVDDLQIEYAVSSTCTGDPDQYILAMANDPELEPDVATRTTAQNRLRTVSAVRITLDVRASAPVGQQLKVGGSTEDGVVRRKVSTVVELRNGC